ncbi:MAG UNVERIFIED_CONTAM: hypothetical protein LVR29_28850 [Microcystis novacekii LVE1205-3]|jgi:hypothetical protein
MKNILPILALLMSVSGIAVSLGREEVRCHLGLESAVLSGRTKNQRRYPPDTPATTPESPRIEETPRETTRKSNLPPKFPRLLKAKLWWNSPPSRKITPVQKYPPKSPHPGN